MIAWSAAAPVTPEAGGGFFSSSTGRPPSGASTWGRSVPSAATGICLSPLVTSITGSRSVTSIRSPCGKFGSTSIDWTVANSAAAASSSAASTSRVVICSASAVRRSVTAPRSTLAIPTTSTSSIATSEEWRSQKK